VGLGLIRALVDGLSFDDAELVCSVIGGLSKVLNVGAEDNAKGESSFVNIMDKCEGSRIVEELKTHDDENVRVNANDFLQKFCSAKKKKWVWRKKVVTQNTVTEPCRTSSHRHAHHSHRTGRFVFSPAVR
jgi:hypothetical protein